MPFSTPSGGWINALRQTWLSAAQDNVGLAAAGVAFFAFLALIPLLGAVVLSYGLLAGPTMISHDMARLTSVLPADAARFVADQLVAVVKTSDSKKGLGLGLALGFALFGARSAAGSIIIALNIAYEQPESRSFVRLNLIALGMTAAGVGVAILALIAVAALGRVESLFPDIPAFIVIIGKVLAYVFISLAGAGGAATLYRIAPDRPNSRWTWITPGTILAALLWLILTIGFGVYASRFGSYNATYGSLSAVVVMLMWLYLSGYALVLGAELNAVLDRQDAAPSDAAP